MGNTREHGHETVFFLCYFLFLKAADQRDKMAAPSSALLHVKLLTWLSRTGFKFSCNMIYVLEHVMVSCTYTVAHA